MSIRPVSRTRSMGVIVDCFLPHLICMDADRLSTGILMFHLKVGFVRTNQLYVKHSDGKFEGNIYRYADLNATLRNSDGMRVLLHR